jgi:hypothetical protein
MPTPTKHAHPQQQQQQVSSSSSSSRNLSRQQDALDALKSGLQDGSAMHKVAQSLQSPDASVVKATLQQLQVGRCSACWGPFAV